MGFFFTTGVLVLDMSYCSFKPEHGTTAAWLGLCVLCVSKSMFYSLLAHSLCADSSSYVIYLICKSGHSISPYSMSSRPVSSARGAVLSLQVRVYNINHISPLPASLFLAINPFHLLATAETLSSFAVWHN